MTQYKSIVVLTGAGISAESGIRTFRDSNGLWENHSIDEVATPEGYYRNPGLVQTFYNQRRQQLSEVKANKAHKALAKFEQQFTGKWLLVTQNVDDLHEQAGSNNLIHMHGELLKVRCKDSDQVFDWHKDVSPETRCPCCNRAGNLRPHIVWFGEMPLEMERIYQALAECDLFISIGTSGNVYPAAGFCQEARLAGAHTVELNLEPGETAGGYLEHHHGPASQVVPDYLSSLQV